VIERLAKGRGEVYTPPQHRDGDELVPELVPEPTSTIPTAIERFLDDEPDPHHGDEKRSGQVWRFVNNCLEHGMSPGEALWATAGWYRPAIDKYGPDVEIEIRRILAKVAWRHQHPGQACDVAGCPHTPSWMGGGAS
jgi:hypothetical protein